MVTVTWTIWPARTEMGVLGKYVKLIGREPGSSELGLAVQLAGLTVAEVDGGKALVLGLFWQKAETVSTYEIVPACGAVMEPARTMLAPPESGKL